MDNFPNQLRKQFSLDSVIEAPSYVATIYENERNHAADIIEEQQKQIRELKIVLRESATRIEEQEERLVKSQYMSERLWDVLKAIHEVSYGRDPDISKLYWPSYVTDVQKIINKLQAMLRNFLTLPMYREGCGCGFCILVDDTRAALGEKKDG